jgi:hypothetical protein
VTSFVGTEGAFCPDGTPLNDCRVPSTFASQQSDAFWDAVTAAWVVRVDADLVRLRPGGTMERMVTLDASVDAFAYRRVAGVEEAFACGRYNRVVHTVDLGTGAVTPLPWPIPSMACTGASMGFSGDGTKLYFAFERSGLFGIASYVLP